MLTGRLGGISPSLENTWFTAGISWREERKVGCVLRLCPLLSLHFMCSKPMGLRSSRAGCLHGFVDLAQILWSLLQWNSPNKSPGEHSNCAVRIMSGFGKFNSGLFLISGRTACNSMDWGRLDTNEAQSSNTGFPHQLWFSKLIHWAGRFP